MQAKVVRHGDWRFENGQLRLRGHLIPVCSFENPIVGHFFVARRTEGWQLCPVIYERSGHGKYAQGMDFYLLTNAPDSVNDEFQRYLDIAKGTDAP